MSETFQVNAFARAARLRIGASLVVTLAALACVLGPVANAAPTWTDWTAASTTGAAPDNTVVGTLDVDGNVVQVTYRGPTDRVELSGAPWWNAAGTPSPWAATGAPDQNDIIRIVGGDSSLYRLIFSTAVVNPIIAFLSAGDGRRQVNYVFNATPTLLGSGSGVFGGCGTCLSVSGNTVSGQEGHGTVQFIGRFTELDWTAPNYEYWQGFTVGASEVSPVPEPSAYVLMASGLVFVGYLARRRKI